MKMTKDVWGDIEAEPQQRAGYARKRIAVPSGINTFLALLLPDLRPAILVEIGAESIPAHFDPPQCSGFRLHLTPLAPGPRGIVLIALELGDAQYRDVFSTLAHDVLACLQEAKDEKSGVRALLERLLRWQDFFKQQKPSLSDNERQGLFGELWFLRNILLSHVHDEAAFNGWRGPEKTNQDFHLDSCAIEVKTTSSNPHEEVTVSNVLQLDETGLPLLIMAHLAVAAIQGTGTTLPALVADLRNHLDSKASHLRSGFDTLLVKSGYRDAHAAEYGQIGYTLRHIRYYQVKDGFPRLREVELPEGVGSVRYTIVIAACKPFEISFDDFKKAVLTGKP